MITKLVMDGVLKLVQVCKHNAESKRVARIFDPRGVIPEAVYNEIEPDTFRDDVNDKVYKLTPTGLTPMLGF